MQKKWYVIVILLIILVFVLKEHKYFRNDQKTTYQIDKYKVEEKFNKKENHEYTFKIDKNKESFQFTIIENNERNRRIIKEIKSFKKNNISCILTVFEKKSKSLICLEDRKQVSLDYLIKNNDSFKDIQKKVKKYKLKYPKTSTVKKDFKNIIVYNNNILENDIYYLWNYKDLYVLEKNNNKTKKVLDYDLYDDILSCSVKEYYVLLENNSVKGIKNVYVYNGKKKKLKSFELEEAISKDSYINGVKNNLIYITDRKKKKEYTLDIFKEKLVLIDDEETKYTTYQGDKKIILNKSDFFMRDYLFKDSYKHKTLKKEVVEEGNYLYYLEDNKMIRVDKKYLKNPTVLFTLEDIKEWEVIKKEVLVLKKDTLYSYTDENGLREILESNELNYNYKDIIKKGEK